MSSCFEVAAAAEAAAGAASEVLIASTVVAAAEAEAAVVVFDRVVRDRFVSGSSTTTPLESSTGSIFSFVGRIRVQNRLLSKLKRNCMTRVIVYRISSGGYKKEKPDYITKESCFMNMLRELLVLSMDTVPCQLFIVADRCNADLLKFIKSSCHSLKLPSRVPIKLIETDIGHGAGSFVVGVRTVVSEKSLTDNDVVYFLEDDYLHVPKAFAKIFEIVESNRSAYATGYDHPDKYGVFDAASSSFKSANPFVDPTSGSEMATEVIYHNGHHWKRTHSTTMTFATKIKTLKADFDDAIGPFVSGSHPDDFHMWNAIELVQKHKLVSPIPSLSTHGETKWLAHGIDWSAIGTKECAVVAKKTETDD